MTVPDRDWNNFRRTLARLESWGLAESAVSAHLADLGAEQVSRLRREGTHVGGVAPTDYERPSKAAVGLFCDKLKRLVKLGGKDLVVTESPALGGFGHTVHGDLYNLDTLRHLGPTWAAPDRDAPDVGGQHDLRTIPDRGATPSRGATPDTST